MQYVFAVALKSKVPRLNHTGVHGANSHFVYFFASDLVKIHDTNA
jgi:hypothetical protein